ncbi:N-acyl homoserine lactonase family protein [Rhizobium sp. P40RR-XXII]|nr:N-acyl homoserine lactonase family protein [Rhizobium sp. P28RR-XV]NLS18519.1 N-acyl homoserine lactonase family protein [Rhizobium sp. P40RR-XXII]
MFQSGMQRCKVRDIRMNQGNGEDYEIPVPWFLLTHPKGNTIIDGGLAAEGLADPRGYWGDVVDSYQPMMTEGQGCLAQLAKLGISHEEIRFVALSHLHSDHSGAVGRFPNATHIVQRREYEYAFAPDWFAAGAYIRRDFDRPGLKWHFLEGAATNGYDLYGDGALRMIFTPGHSVGHQSFLVQLSNTGTILLTIDAAYTLDHWNEKALPGLMASAVDTVRSVGKLRALAGQTDAMVVTGHDPEVWPRFRQAPAYYD